MVGYLQFNSTYNLCIYSSILNMSINGTRIATKCLSSSLSYSTEEFDLKYLHGQEKAVLYIIGDKKLLFWNITQTNLESGISLVPNPLLSGVTTPYNYSKTIEVFNSNGSNVILLGINNLLYGFRITQTGIKAWASFPKGTYDDNSYQTMAMCQNLGATGTSKRFVGMMVQSDTSYFSFKLMEL